MAQDKPPSGRIKARYTLFYVLSVAALVALLCTNFGVIYTLALAPPEDPEMTMKLVYIVMVAGFLVLAAQALLIFTRVLAALGRDSREMEQMREQIDQLSVYDELTKVYNRYKFESVAEREMDKVRRYATPLSAVMFDIDDFKGINESHGYKTGDLLLINLARFVGARLRKTDYVFRWRGGKFIILAPHTDIDKAAIMAEKLRQIVGHKLFGGKIRMRLSLGVAQCRSDDTVETFLHRLQSALTGAKSQGRNRVVLARD